MLNKIGILPERVIIPKFTSVLVGKTDDEGNDVRYSFIEDYILYVYTSQNISTIVTPKAWPVLYNGQFKKYDNIFTITSYPYETFTLTGLNPETNPSNKVYLDHNNFHVYIETVSETDGRVAFTEYKQVENLVLDAAYNDNVFELRLNEDKDYVIKFGDNIHGKMPVKGSLVHVVYLQSNGEKRNT